MLARLSVRVQEPGRRRRPVRALHVRGRAERRELLTLEVTDHDGTVHPARSLSDGMLRFLALAILEADPQARGLVCLEEPENGIHPRRIPAMLQLLQDIAVDVECPVGPDDLLRQVIVNTHSPAVVPQVPDASLLVAEWKEIVQEDSSRELASAGCRARDGQRPTQMRTRWPRAGCWRT